MPPPEYWHGRICLFVAILLETYGSRTGLGHASTNDSRVLIDDNNVRGADVSYYSEARWPQARAGLERPPAPPDLVVEVLSPNDRPGDVQIKVGQYLTAGIAMVWAIDPEPRRLTIYRRDDPTPRVVSESESVDGLPELPGFRCRVAEFFSRA